MEGLSEALQVVRRLSESPEPTPNAGGGVNENIRFRVESEDDPSYTGKILSALRNQFGGHKAT